MCSRTTSLRTTPPQAAPPTHTPTPTLYPYPYPYPYSYPYPYPYPYAAPGSPSSVAAKEEVLLPPPLRGGRAPRRSDFTEASEMRLRDFRALVRLFGDYMQDREMWNCQADSRPTH